MAYTFSFKRNPKSTILQNTKNNKNKPSQAEVYRCNFADLPKFANKYTMYYTADTGDIYIGQGSGKELKLISDNCHCSGDGNSKDEVATKQDIEKIAAKFN